MEKLFATWVEEDDGLQRRVLVLIDLNVVEGLNQLIQHSVADSAELRLRTVPVDHAAVACRHTQWSAELSWIELCCFIRPLQALEMQNFHIPKCTHGCVPSSSADSILSGHSSVMSNTIYKRIFGVTMKQKAPVNHWRTEQHLNKLQTTALNRNLASGLEPFKEAASRYLRAGSLWMALTSWRPPARGVPLHGP